MEIKTSETITALSAAMCKAQAKISVVQKDAKNPHFKSSYATLAAVRDAVIPALNSEGMSVLQFPGVTTDGSVPLTTRIMHSSGEWMECTCTAPMQQQTPQGYGSTITYLRRYSLAAITGLAQDDDDGNEASRRRVERAEVTQATLQEPLVDITDLLAGFASARSKSELAAASAAVKNTKGISIEQLGVLRQAAVAAKKIVEETGNG